MSFQVCAELGVAPRSYADNNNRAPLPPNRETHDGFIAIGSAGRNPVAAPTLTRRIFRARFSRTFTAPIVSPIRSAAAR